MKDEKQRKELADAIRATVKELDTLVSKAETLCLDVRIIDYDSRSQQYAERYEVRISRKIDY